MGEKATKEMQILGSLFSQIGHGKLDLQTASQPDFRLHPVKRSDLLESLRRVLFCNCKKKRYYKSPDKTNGLFNVRKDSIPEKKTKKMHFWERFPLAEVFDHFRAFSRPIIAPEMSHVGDDNVREKPTF